MADLRQGPQLVHESKPPALEHQAPSSLQHGPGTEVPCSRLSCCPGPVQDHRRASLAGSARPPLRFPPRPFPYSASVMMSRCVHRCAKRQAKPQPEGNAQSRRSIRHETLQETGVRSFVIPMPVSCSLVIARNKIMMMLIMYDGD